ncbi:MAG: MerR family transcriptional regulator [Candidatus Marinimicrobia bacterium]|nr:MerR family transcriptional regulator [Candidatus Neomarinimicrobiota bacterium]
MKYKGIKKLYYSISEISEMLGIKQSVIRYWESEFKELHPQKNRAGNRIYKKDDISILRMIHHYVHEKHLSIHEANEVILDLKKEGLYKRKLAELSKIEPVPVETKKEVIETVQVEEQTSELETVEVQTPEPEAKKEKEEESKFEIVTPTQETFIYPLDESRKEAPIEKETTPEEIIEPEPDTPQIFEEPAITEDIVQTEPEKIIEPESLPDEEPEEEVVVLKEEAKQSDPELKELLRKISGNIRDIIDILNE